MSKSYFILCLLLIVGLFGCSNNVSDESDVGEIKQAVCSSPPITTGDVGNISHTRYISAITPHPTEPYSLRVSWAVNGVTQSTKTISFGSRSGAVVKGGNDCMLKTGF